MTQTHITSKTLKITNFHATINSVRIYKPGTKFNKETGFYQSFPLADHSIFQILETKKEMARKNMMNPYFSQGTDSSRRASDPDFHDKILNDLKASIT